MFKSKIELIGLEHLSGSEPTILVVKGRTKDDGVLLSKCLTKTKKRIFFPVDANFVSKKVPGGGHPYMFGGETTSPNFDKVVEQIEQKKDTVLIVFAEQKISKTNYLGGASFGLEKLFQKLPDANFVTSVIKQKKGLLSTKHKVYLSKPHTTKTLMQERDKKVRQKMVSSKVKQVYDDLLFDVDFEANKNLTRMFLDGAKDHSYSKKIFSQAPDISLTYRRVYLGAWALGSKLKAHKKGSRMGVLLPTSAGACVTVYAAVLKGVVPVMLNPAAGKAQVLSACETANIDTIYTAQAMLNQSNQVKLLVDELRLAGKKIVLLENLRAQIGVLTKVVALLASFFPNLSARLQPGYKTQKNEAACIMFTSGSESRPKGVVLSHANILANAVQITTFLPLDQTESKKDLLLNSLPIFHAFGLTVGIFLPIKSGIPAIQYPTPLHYATIPQLIHSRDVTIFFSADTFLKRYAEESQDHYFQTLRLVVAGSEKLKKPTLDLWQERFGVHIYEGYGVSEASPVISVNIPGQSRIGTVGKVLPKMEAVLEKREDIEEGGVLKVRGPNIMVGYLLSSSKGKIIPPKNGWHDTGDIATIDKGGYITLKGRFSRFVKVAGEMVPLDNIEQLLCKAWPKVGFAVVDIESKSRGRDVALLTTLSNTEVQAKKIDQKLVQAGLPNLWLPRVTRVVEELPVLPSGKTDYVTAQKMVEG